MSMFYYYCHCCFVNAGRGRAVRHLPLKTSISCKDIRWLSEKGVRANRSLTQPDSPYRHHDSILLLYPLRMCWLSLWAYAVKTPTAHGFYYSACILIGCVGRAYGRMPSRLPLPKGFLIVVLCPHRMCW